MLLRRLLTGVVLTVIHGAVSCIALMLISGLPESGGCDGIVYVILAFFYFPFFGFYLAGLGHTALDSPLGLAINSAIWVAVVYSLYLAWRRAGRTSRRPCLWRVWRIGSLRAARRAEARDEL